MNKNIYDMLNEVEIDLNEYTKEHFTDIERKKFKNTLRKSTKKNNAYYKKGLAIASIAVLTIGLLGTNSEGYVWTYANTIFTDIASSLGIEKNLDEYKTVVNKSITKNGVTIQLNEVVLDHDELVVSATSTSNKKLGEGRIILDHCIYVNGERVSNGAGGSAKQLDEYTMQEVLFHDLEGDFSGDLNIKIVFSDPLINEKTIEGRWVFEFKTNGDELALDTAEILLDTTFTLENGQKITLNKYTSNNLGQKIYYSNNPKGTDYDMVLRGHDALGNKVEFYVSRATANNGVFKLTTIDGNLDENAKTLSLTPYAVKYPEENGRLSNDFKKVGEEFEIALPSEN